MLQILEKSGGIDSLCVYLSDSLPLFLRFSVSLSLSLYLYLSLCISLSLYLMYVCVLGLYFFLCGIEDRNQGHVHSKYTVQLHCIASP